MRGYQLGLSAFFIWSLLGIGCHQPPPSRPLCTATSGCASNQRCQEGQCVCAPTYGRCGGLCVPLLHSQAHCGACNQLCTQGRLCVEGQCTCTDGETDCGSCTNTKTDSSHCGACNRPCDGIERCVDGQCCPEHKATLCPSPDAPGTNQCTDLNSDTAHCGKCNQPCQPDQICHVGRCQCPVGQRLCGNRCIDPTSDPDHCGQCDNLCKSHEACASGRCVSKCPADTPDRCGRTCCHTKTHPRHCGKCGVVCPKGQRCHQGKCECPPHHRQCGQPARCVDPQVDPAHCGICGHKCNNGTICAEGRCIPQCPPHQPDRCAGGCFQRKTSPQHCGRCGVSCLGGQLCTEGRCQCPPGTSLCDGRCIETQSNPIHCGACNQQCSAGMLCAKGQCVDACPKDRSTTCYGACFETDGHAQNCGECGNPCLPAQQCQGGICQCPTGTALCVDRCVDTQTHPGHCGGCDNPCKDTQVCERGRCVEPCPTNTPNRCDNTCTDTQTSPQHCGQCGHLCPKGATCQQGQCNCPQGQIDCQGACVDTSQDPLHCGACNKPCPADQSCLNKMCTSCQRCLHCPHQTCNARDCHHHVAQVGSKYNDLPARITTDKAGNSYALGIFRGTVIFGNHTLTSTEGYSFFVAKRDPLGQYLWVQQLNVSSKAPAPPVQGAIQLDCLGNIYVAHAFRSQLQAGPFSAKGADLADTVFLTKLDPTGRFVWLQTSTNLRDSSAQGIAIHDDGRIFLAGNALGSISFGNTSANAPTSDMQPYLAQWTHTGQLKWLKRPFQASQMQILGLALTPSGQLAITGRFQQQIQLGTQRWQAEATDAFVGVIANDGQPTWLQALGGTSIDEAHDVTTDAQGNLYITGFFQQKIKCGNAYATHAGYGAFVAKFGPKGTTQWIVTPIPKAKSAGDAIAIGPKGQVFVTGIWFGTDPVQTGNATLQPKGESGAFVLRLEPLHGAVTWADSAGGPQADLGTHDISVDPFGNVHTIGCFANTATASQIPITSRGAADVLLWKIGATAISP